MVGGGGGCQWRLKLPSHSPNMTLSTSRYEQFLELLIHTDGLSDHADKSFPQIKLPDVDCGRDLRLDLTN